MPKKSTPTKTRATGRPSLYLPEYCDKLINHMAGGLSFETFAGTVNVCSETLYEWVRVHKDFSLAYKKGTDKRKLFGESVYRAAMLSMPFKLGGVDIHPKDMNPTLLIFYLKQLGWRDKQDVTSGGEKLEGPKIYLPDNKRDKK